MSIFNKVMLVVIVLLVIAVSFVAYLIFFNKPSQDLSLVPTPLNEKNATIAQAALLKQAALQFPEIKSKTLVTNIPQELNFLVSSSAFTQNKILFVDDRNGYEINGESSSNLREIHAAFLSLLLSNKFQIITNASADVYALVEAKNSVYEIRVEQIYRDTAKVEIKINIIENK
jgi:hypothetical protein